MAKTVAEMKAALAVVNDQMTGLLAQQTAMKTALDTAVADLATAVAGQQSTIIDTVTAALDTISGQLTIASTNTKAMQDELAAAIAAVPPPTS